MGGMPVPNEDLVNLPNWLVLKLRIEGEEVLRLADVELLSYRHEYDIRSAVVSRTLRFRDRAGRETTLRSRRFVSMAHGHQAGIEWTLTPENWSGRVEVDLGPRRPGHEPWRGALPGAGGPASGARVPADVRARGDRADGAHTPVADPRRAGGPHARLLEATEPVRRAAQAPSDGGLRPAGARLRRTQGAPIRVEKMVALLHLARPRDQRAARQRRQVGRATTRRSTRRSPSHRVGVGRALGGVRPGPARATRACSCCCAFTSPTCCRSARATRPSTMPASSRAA